MTKSHKTCNEQAKIIDTFGTYHVHGDGEAPGGDSSLLQGTGTASPGSPDLETATAAEQRRDREKGLFSRGFPDEG